MTIPLASQIESAERELADNLDNGHLRGRDTTPSLPEASALLIRLSATLGLHLADRIDPTHKPV
jgi:hypothetical protein